MEELATNLGYQRGIREARARASELSAAIRKDEVSLVADLNSLGVPVASVWDFVNDDVIPPVDAVPVFVQHLTLVPHHKGVREGILRALAHSHLKEAAEEPLRRLYGAVETEGEQWLVANALASMTRYREVQDLPAIEQHRGLWHHVPSQSSRGRGRTT